MLLNVDITPTDFDQRLLLPGKNIGGLFLLVKEDYASGRSCIEKQGLAMRSETAETLFKKAVDPESRFQRDN
jgi:hypothetical protein